MALNKSNFLRNKFINTQRGSSLAAPAQMFVALYLTDPTAGDTGTEVSAGNYARQVITWEDPSAPGGTPGVTANDADVSFGVASVGYGTVTHAGIRDAAVGGNLWYFGPLSTPKTVQAGDELVFRAGEIDLSET